MILTIIQFGKIKHIKKNTLIIEEKQKNENIFFLLQGIAYNYCLFEMIVKEYSILKITIFFLFALIT